MIDEEYFKNIEKVIHDYMTEFEAVYKKTLLQNDHKATGNLINSIMTTLKVGEDTYEVWLNVADYYYYVDKGRRKDQKRPPIKDILKWVKAKNILPLQPSNLPRDKQDLSTAFAIAKSIAKKGTMKRFGYDRHGSNSLAHTLEEVNNKYLPLLQEALENDWYTYSLTLLDEIGKIRV